MMIFPPKKAMKETERMTCPPAMLAPTETTTTRVKCVLWKPR